MSNEPSPPLAKKLPSRGVIMAAAATVLFVASLSQTTVTTALPNIVSDLNGMENLTWVVTAYLMASTVSAPIFGKLSDLYGRKFILQTAIAIFVLGTLVAGLAANMFMLIAGRGIQGMGGGGLMVVAMAVVADTFPPRERGKAQGVLGTVFGTATVVGPLTGGFLVEHLSWHWIFFLKIPVALAALLVISLVLPASKRVSRSVDYFGAVMLGATLSSIVLLFSMGGTNFAWTSSTAFALMAFIVIAVIGFIVAEGRAKEPILPLPLFRNNNFIVSNGVGTVLGVSMFGCVTFMPLYMQVVKGVSPANSGMFLLVMMVGLFSSSTAAGFFVSRTGKYKLLPIIASLVLSVGFAALASLNQNSSLLLVTIYMLLVGLGIGPSIAVGVSSIQNAVPQTMLGVATASASMFRLIGGAIGVSIFGAIFAAGLSSRLATILPVTSSRNALDPQMIAALPPELRDQALSAFVAAIQPIFLISAVLALMSFVLSLFLHEVAFDSADGPSAVKPANAPAE